MSEIKKINKNEFCFKVPVGNEPAMPTMLDLNTQLMPDTATPLEDMQPIKRTINSASCQGSAKRVVHNFRNLELTKIKALSEKIVKVAVQKQLPVHEVEKTTDATSKIDKTETATATTLATTTATPVKTSPVETSTAASPETSTTASPETSTAETATTIANSLPSMPLLTSLELIPVKSSSYSSSSKIATSKPVLIPPKITVTAPTESPVKISDFLDHSNFENKKKAERLSDVKKLLNRKLLDKKEYEIKQKILEKECKTSPIKLITSSEVNSFNSTQLLVKKLQDEKRNIKISPPSKAKTIVDSIIITNPTTNPNTNTIKTTNLSIPSACKSRSNKQPMDIVRTLNFDAIDKNQKQDQKTSSITNLISPKKDISIKKIVSPHKVIENLDQKSKSQPENKEQTCTGLFEKFVRERATQNTKLENKKETKNINKKKKILIPQKILPFKNSATDASLTDDDETLRKKALRETLMRATFVNFPKELIETKAKLCAETTKSSPISVTTSSSSTSSSLETKPTITKTNIKLSDYSPIKKPLPDTINTANQPLPNIYTFKKPYPIVTQVSSSFRSVHSPYANTSENKNDGKAIVDVSQKQQKTQEQQQQQQQQQTQKQPQPQQNKQKAVQKNVIVLEAKVLSQDEKIDINNLCLSGVKKDKDNFAIQAEKSVIPSQKPTIYSRIVYEPKNLKFLQNESSLMSQQVKSLADSKNPITNTSMSPNVNQPSFSIAISNKYLTGEAPIELKINKTMSIEEETAKTMLAMSAVNVEMDDNYNKLSYVQEDIEKKNSTAVDIIDQPINDKETMSAVDFLATLTATKEEKTKFSDNINNTNSNNNSSNDSDSDDNFNDDDDHGDHDDDDDDDDESIPDEFILTPITNTPSSVEKNIDVHIKETSLTEKQIPSPIKRNDDKTDSVCNPVFKINKFQNELNSTQLENQATKTKDIIEFMSDIEKLEENLNVTSANVVDEKHQQIVKIDKIEATKIENNIPGLILESPQKLEQLNKDIEVDASKPLVVANTKTPAPIIKVPFRRKGFKPSILNTTSSIFGAKSHSTAAYVPIENKSFKLKTVASKIETVDKESSKKVKQLLIEEKNIEKAQKEQHTNPIAQQEEIFKSLKKNEQKQQQHKKKLKVTPTKCTIESDENFKINQNISKKTKANDLNPTEEKVNKTEKVKLIKNQQKLKFQQQSSLTDSIESKKSDPKSIEPFTQSDSITDNEIDADIDTCNEISSPKVKQPKVKRLRKTFDANKTQNVSDIDSDEGNNDTADFLGFDETSPIGNNLERSLELLIAITSGEEDSALKAKTETSKTEISPISKIDEQEVKSMEESKATKETTSSFRRNVPLKKRWEVTQIAHEETNITDNTLAIDDADSAEITNKRKLKNVESIQLSKMLRLSKDVNEEIAEMSEVNIENKQPKKRGRPSKCKVLKEEKSANSTIDLHETEVLTIKRSRQVKKFFDDDIFDTSVTETTSPSLTKMTSTTPTIKMKRGRKPKQKIESFVRFEEKEFEAEEQSIDPLTQSLVLDSSVNSELTSVKKRGRPKLLEKINIENVENQIKSEQQCSSDISATDSPVEIQPKKRGRKPKSLKSEQTSIGEIELLENEQLEDIKNDDIYSSQHSLQKKRGRKPKTLQSLAVNEPENQRKEPDESTNQNKEEIPTNLEQRKPGRKPKCAEFSDLNTFNPRLLLITKREQLETDEQITAETQGTGCIKCGLCLAKTDKKLWAKHLTEHYGVGWIIGEQQELNLTSRNAVLHTMTNYFKTLKSGKGLICRICKNNYRSALGLLLHLENCGAEAKRFTCEKCKKDYAKSSFVYHMRTCEVLNAVKSSDDEEEIENTNFKVFNNFGRPKRTSLIKAENKIKKFGEELQNFDPKQYIKYQPAFEITDEIIKNWTTDLQILSKIFCPEKDCKFFAMNLEDMKTHITSCKFNSLGFICLICDQETKIFQTKEKAKKHVMKIHKMDIMKEQETVESSDCSVKMDDDTSDDDEDDVSSGVNSSDYEIKEQHSDDEEIDGSISKIKRLKKSFAPSKRKFNTKQRQISHNSPYKVYPQRHANLAKWVAQRWKQFATENFTTTVLFPYAEPIYDSCTNKNMEKSLPKQKYSMKFSFTQRKTLYKIFGAAEPMEWCELKRFETVTNKNDIFSYIGAPITAQVWIPLPVDIDEQYLVTIHRKNINTYTRLNNPPKKNSILFVHKVLKGSNTYPECNIHYAFCIPDGQVHCVTFLPSGGYNAEMNRLGLMAVGTITSTIKIYALPINVNVTKSVYVEGQRIKIISLTPSLMLNLDLSTVDCKDYTDVYDKNADTTHCLQICWSETAEHQYIFAGFSDGFVAIWDIGEEDNLNKFIIDNVRHFVPLNHFYTNTKFVRYLALHYDVRGPRWLSVGCSGRRINFYDILNKTQPIILKSEEAKNIVRDLEWPIVWEPNFISLCDTFTNNGRMSLAINPINFVYQHTKIQATCVGATQSRYNTTTNVHATASENGDILFIEPREAHLDEITIRNGFKSCAVALDVKLLNGDALSKVHKNQFPEDWELYEDDYREKYGLVFSNVVNHQTGKSNREALNEERQPPLNVLRYTRINSLRWNINARGLNLLAIGYENGFMRIMKFPKEEFFS